MKRTTKRTTSRKRASAARTASAPKRRTKAKLTEQQLAQTFSRAVNAGNATLARKIASELKKRTPYGIYAGGVSVNDLRAFEGLTKRKKR